MKTASLRYIVKAFAENGVARIVAQVSSLPAARLRADVSAMRQDTDHAYVLDLESPVGRGHKIIYSAK